MSFPPDHPLSFERWDCSKYGHWGRHDGPHLCAKCGEHIKSVLPTEPYDYGAARRELEAIHRFLAEHFDRDPEGEWGNVCRGHDFVEWDEVGGSVEAIRKLISAEWFGGYCQAKVTLGRREEQLERALERAADAMRRALAQWRDPHGEDLHHQHAFEGALTEARSVLADERNGSQEVASAPRSGADSLPERGIPGTGAHRPGRTGA